MALKLKTEDAVKAGGVAAEKAREIGGEAASKTKDILETVADTTKALAATTAGRTSDALEEVRDRSKGVVAAAAKGAKKLSPKARARARRRERRRRIRSSITAFGMGALVAYFLDPDNGKRRRNIARDRLLAMVRGGARKGARLGRYAASTTYGKVQQLRHMGPDEPPPNDATLARKVESEALGGSPLKSRVSVNAENGVLVLRGRLDRDEDVRDLEERVRAVSGVRDVRNLLQTGDAEGAAG